MAPGDNRQVYKIPEQKLGPAEAFFERIHNAFSGGSAILCICARMAGPLDIQLVKQSCRRLWERHSLLRARISARDNGPHFICDVPFNRIPIHSVFELGKTDIRTFVEREMDSPFDTARCLWKVLLITDKVKLNKHYLIVCAHRSISDPFSTVNLVREMIAGCVDIVSGKAAKIDLLPLSPNFEEIAASIPESLFSEKGIEKEEGRELGRMPCHGPAEVSTRHTRVRSHMIRPARLNELKNLSSAEKATMRGTLAAVTVMAMQKQLKESASFEILTPCSIRKLSNREMSEDKMRSLSYDARVRSQNIADRAGFWKFARDYETGLLGSAPAGDWLADASKIIEDPALSSGLPLSFSLVHVNEIGHIRNSPFTIENVLFARGCRSADQLMFISAMPVEGGLSLTFAYASPLLDEAWVDRFIKTFIHIIDKIIK